jgi:oxygen-independent coproporphyrinogen-3 oxidase
MASDPLLYQYWREFPDRDVEYVRWYPPTLALVEPEEILGRIGVGPAERAFYLHVPFCKDICPYCPFNKFSMRGDRAAAFLEGVAVEIALVAESQREAGIRTTAGYFGGGTPTALETPDLLRLIENALESFSPVAGAEITIEANPDTVDAAKLRALRAAGITRISFGVQSFTEQYLRLLGRTHSAGEALGAILMAREAGFDNVAIDLMYRLPGQSVSDWERDLETALEAGVEHISTYCLFLDPGTKLYNQTLSGRVAGYPSEEAEVEMYRVTQARLGAAGFRHYTINDFALHGRESHHHRANWQAPQGSYVGLGPGAFGFLGGAPGSYVYCTIHSLGDYLASTREGRLPVRLANRLDRREEMARYMVLGLRCLEVGKHAFRSGFGAEMEEVFAGPITRLTEWGLIESDRDRLWMTDRGKHYASNVLKAFFTPPNQRKPQPIGVELLAGRGLSLASVDYGRV